MSLPWGAGCEDYLFPEFVESNITLTNGQIIQGLEIADHAFGLTLSLTRNIAQIIRGESQGLPRSLELRGKTMLIIGMGGLECLSRKELSPLG